jgi:hypothetical protein
VRSLAAKKAVTHKLVEAEDICRAYIRAALDADDRGFLLAVASVLQAAKDAVEDDDFDALRRMAL